MSKRRLTEQQQRVIEQRRQHTHASHQQGLVIANFGVTAEVESTDGGLIACHLRQNLGGIVCGDTVDFILEDNASGVIVDRHPRRSLLGRPDASGQLKPIAANIDQMIIVIAPQPEINFVLLDSYLVLAEHLSINALIVLNKIDLLNPHDLERINHQLDIYRTLGYPVCCISIKQAHLKALHTHLDNKTHVVVGQSGVGKSSLIDHLIPYHAIRIGDLTKRSAKGRHTTTTAKLYHGPNGDFIDSPGIRECRLWQMDIPQVAAGFREFKPHECKYRDCRHQHDQGCAITQAVQAGEITTSRYQSFMKICEKL